MRIFSEQAKTSRSVFRAELLIGLGSLVVIFVLVIGQLEVFLRPPSSHRTSCVTNLKQLGLGVIMYSTDHDDLAPPAFTFDGEAASRKFFSLVGPYHKHPELFQCPNDQGQANARPYDDSREGVPGLNSYVHCYSLRAQIGDFTAGKRKLDFDKIVNPTGVGLMRDPVRRTGVIEGKPALKSPHEAGFVFVFADIHAKTLTQIDPDKDL